MFLVVPIQRAVCVAPHEFGPDMIDVAHYKVMRALEGTYDPRYGFVLIVKLPSNNDMSRGEFDRDGSVRFVMRVNALVFRVFRNEVVPAVVTHVLPASLELDIGPVRGTVQQSQIPRKYEYDDGVFFPNDNGTPIERDTTVFVRVIGPVSADGTNTNLVILCTLLGKNLGPLITTLTMDETE